MSLVGHLDALLTSGYIEGWICDRTDPGANPEVRVVAGTATIARGFACRFRRDLMEAGLSWGWNSFRLRLAKQPPPAPTQPSLRLFSGMALVWSGPVRWVHDQDHQYTSVAHLISGDPTQVRDPAMLQGLRNYLKQVHASLGAEAFVRRCYLAILGRAADPSGMAGYTQALATGRAEPFDIVAGLMNSVEFRNRSNGLHPPVLPSFPFRLATDATSPAKRAGVIPRSRISGA